MKKFSSLKIKHQISLMVSVLVVFQVILFGVSYFAMTDINSNFEDLFEKRLPSIDNLVQADRDFQQALVAERTLLLSGITGEASVKQIKDFWKNKKQVMDRFETYKKLSTLPAEKKHIADFVAKYDKWSKASLELFKIDENGLVGNPKEIQEASLGTLANLFESSRDELDALQEIIQTQAKLDFITSQDDFAKTKYFMYGLVGLSFLLSLVTSFFCIRAINKKIQKTIDAISGESIQLNSISDDLSNRASGLASASAQQAASVTQTSSSLHEISQMVKNNTTSAVSSADMIKNGKIDLDRSLKMIFDLARKIQDINNATNELVNKVDENHTKFGDILNVFNNVQEKTSVINDIVFQTKLLSFNASVEAARAGEHGKGFAVVAEEVGNLAQMSGKSADEISTLLSESLENINGIIVNSKEEVNGAVKKNEAIIQQTLTISKECEEVLQAVEKMFDAVTDSSTKIAQASKEQDVGVEEINTAVQEINNSNQITSDNASQVEEQSGHLVLVVNNLKSSIEELKKAV